MQHGFFYDFSNYGSYERLQDDGLTQWHPAFLPLGTTLDLCAALYRKFCPQYRPNSKRPCKSHWGSRMLAQIKKKIKARQKGTQGRKVSGTSD